MTSSSALLLTWRTCVFALALALSGCASVSARRDAINVDPGAFHAIGAVEERFQSYNVEMAEVVGARFWAPYNADGSPPADRFRQRPPLDLSNTRLRTLARALGPAYVRVSGTWANSTYFQYDDNAPIAPPQSGTGGVLTRAQWAGVVEFAREVDAEIVTSFAINSGVRDANGAWNPDQARRLLQYTHELGGRIAAIAPINEPSLGSISGLPQGYDAAAFARDNAAFRALIEREAPEALIVGPTAASEAGNFMPPRLAIALRAEDLLSAEPRPRFDVFNYHLYTSASKRCVQPGATPDLALSEEWLNVAERVHRYYLPLHDRFTPGAPIWVTEIGEASCGGDPWASTYADTFRYVDNMARLAKLGVSAIFHNTLAASDYALIDEHTLEPRPSYWAAVLWRRLMGRTVLDAGPLQPGLHLYAHCLRDAPGGVALVAINLSQAETVQLRLPVAAQRFTLSSPELTSATLDLNGQTLAMLGDELPSLDSARTRAGLVALPSASITFLSMAGANNSACR